MRVFIKSGSNRDCWKTSNLKPNISVNPRLKWLKTGICSAKQVNFALLFQHALFELPAFMF